METKSNKLKTCRFCGAPLEHVFADLGMSPPSNAYVRKEDFASKEPSFPLCAYVCSKCFLVQVEEFERPDEIFNTGYAYFSSYSDSWLAHCRAYVAMIGKKLKLTKDSLVVELASNDGYLLQYFQGSDVPVLGIEPSAGVAAVAQRKGIQTLVRFFGSQLARELKEQGTMADLLLGNNVLAHVPGLNDFVAGMKELLKPQGVITMEFPHLAKLIEYSQFDTIYHEHFSYFSLLTAEQIFRAHGLRIFDVEELPTHGGSLRIYTCHANAFQWKETGAVDKLIQKEKAAGLNSLEQYLQFDGKIKKVKAGLLGFLETVKSKGKTIAGYGAAAKGNTLLNYCGITNSSIMYVVDKNPHKQNHYLPGSRIPVYHPDTLRETKPDYVLILPWNIKEEIIEQISYIRDWNGAFVTAIPEVSVL